MNQVQLHHDAVALKAHDAAALKALTHPLRVQILDVLRAEEQVTATSLAAQLSETSGATSYHLRQLARRGLIEEVPAAGRERWWRLAAGGSAVDAREFLDHLDSRASSLPEVFAARTTLRLAPEQARALGTEIAELVDRFRLVSNDDAVQRVELSYALVPVSTARA